MDAESSAGFPWLKRGWLMLIAALPLAALLIYIVYLGWFSRYLADDFCTAGWLNRLGFFGSQGYWRQSWSGRFSFFFTMNLLHLLGFWVPKVLTAFLMLASWLSLYWLSNKIMKSISGGKGHWLTAASAIVVLASTLASAPGLYQSVLWQTGALTYWLPQILLTLQVAWMLHCSLMGRSNGTNLPALFGSTLLALVAGGYSETVAAVQFVLLLSILMFVELGLWPGQRSIGRRQTGAAITGGLAALILIIGAPGNSVRQGLLGPAAGLDQVVLRSAYDSYLLAARIYRHELVWTLLALLVPLLGMFWWLNSVSSREEFLADIDWRRWWAYLLAIPLLTVALVAATMAPSEYAIASYPDSRVLITAHYWIMVGLAVWGGVLGLRLASVLPLVNGSGWRLVATLTILGLSAYALLSFVADTRSLRQDAVEFAAAWDGRHQQLLVGEPVGSPVKAASLSHMAGLDELERDPNHWVNRCVGMTYGVGQVVAK